MSQLAANTPVSAGPDLELLQKVARGMPIAADLSRSDLLLTCPLDHRQMLVVAQAQPRSISPLYTSDLTGSTLSAPDVPLWAEAVQSGRQRHAHRDLPRTGAPVMQSIYPVIGQAGKPIAFLSLETSLIQLERHRGRHVSFRRAVEWLKGMCLRGELAETDRLSRFGEWDGVVLVDSQRRITYLSGIANNLYRRLGYQEDLRGRRLSHLNTDDDEMVAEALLQRRPLERECQEGTLLWNRKVLPLWPAPLAEGLWPRLAARLRPAGETVALVLLHDATDEARKQQELKVKSTMIQEVHHRVKNNLQAIAAMLRMQARRTKEPGALHVLNEATSRILSVAVIHEFLSVDESQTINIRDVCGRIIAQNRQVVIKPGMQISFVVEGPAVYLPSQQATTCALVINELIQNALEHGFENKRQGTIRINLTDGGDWVRVEIWDDGTRLPADFALESTPSLGLQIVRTLVQDDLHGKLRLENKSDGVTAAIEFPKATY